MRLTITYKDGSTETVEPDLATLVAAEEAGWTQETIASRPLSFASFLGYTATDTADTELVWRGRVGSIDVTTEPLDPTARED